MIITYVYYAFTYEIYSLIDNKHLNAKLSLVCTMTIIHILLSFMGYLLIDIYKTNNVYYRYISEILINNSDKMA